jgi:hypothetical protein
MAVLYGVLPYGSLNIDSRATATHLVRCGIRLAHAISLTNTTALKDTTLLFFS